MIMLGISSRLDQMFVKEKLESFAIFYPSLITEVGVKDVHEFAKISIFVSLVWIAIFLLFDFLRETRKNKKLFYYM